MEDKEFWKAIQELSPRLFATYMAITELANNEDGYCSETNQEIAERLGKNKDNVSKDISLLIQKEFLYSIEVKKGFVCIERMLYPNTKYEVYIKDKESK